MWWCGQAERLEKGRSKLLPNEDDATMPYTFCPQCATRLQPRKVDDRDLLVCPACGWVFYNNSAPCVGVVVVRERPAGIAALRAARGQEMNVGQERSVAIAPPAEQASERRRLASCPQVLLVKRAVEPFKGYWDIPGGFLESGEHPAEGAKRETLEETGLVIEPTEVLGFFMDVYGPENEPTLNICYLAEIVGGEEKAGSDAEGLGWFALDELPERIAFSWEREALQAVRMRG